MLNRITVQLPVEGLLFWKLSGREAMSESFALTLTLLGTDARIDRSKLLGQVIRHEPGKVRRLNIVNEMKKLGKEYSNMVMVA